VHGALAIEVDVFELVEVGFAVPYILVQILVDKTYY